MDLSHRGSLSSNRLSKFMLPNFICIGTLKCGTTSLAEWLRQHPDVFLPDIKEPRFFCYDPGNHSHRAKPVEIFPIRTLQDYVKLFENGKDRQAIGEASPQYLGSSYACRRIHELLPSARLVATIRHPIERAYSQYWMRVRAGVETRPFKEALSFDEGWVKNSYYYENLKRYMDLFGKPAVHVIIFEELIRNSESTLHALCDFLRIDYTLAATPLPRENTGSAYPLGLIERMTRHPRLRLKFRGVVPKGLLRKIRSFSSAHKPIPRLDDGLKEILMADFRMDIDRTSRLLGIDLYRLWERQPPNFSR